MTEGESLIGLRRMGSLTPDYSTFCDSGEEICRWNLYRSRLIGYHLEKLGIPVIPTLIWWSEESLDMALSGLAPGQVSAHRRQDLLGT